MSRLNQIIYEHKIVDTQSMYAQKQSRNIQKSTYLKFLFRLFSSFSGKFFNQKCPFLDW